jgi:hypothetical protein
MRACNVLSHSADLIYRDLSNVTHRTRSAGADYLALASRSLNREGRRDPAVKARCEFSSAEDMLQ